MKPERTRPQGEADRILLMEDNPGNARLIEEMLSDAGGRLFDLVRVERLSAGLERLAAGDVAAVLLDLGLPDSQGLETFDRVQRQAPQVPIILLTGQDDEELAIRAVRQGGQDYLVKGQVDGRLLARTLRYGIERKRAEAELLKLRKAVNASGEVVYMTDHNGLITSVNPEFTRLYGYAAEEVVGKTTPRILKSELLMKPEDYATLWQTILSKQVVKGEFVNKTKDGRLLNIEGSINPVLDDGNIVGFLAIQRDITGRKRAEEEVRHLLEAERDQRALAEALRDTAAALNSTLDFGKVLDHILTNVARLVPHDAGDILLVEPAGPVSAARSRGYAERGLADWAADRRFALADFASLRQIVESGRPVVIPDTQSFPGWADVPETRWIRSYVCAPINLRQHVVGFISLNSLAPGVHTEEHAQRLQAFADQAAAALENAWLFDEVKRGQERVRVLRARLAESEENERRELSKALHDQVGQSLTALSINLTLLRSQLGCGSVEEQAARVTASLETVVEIADGIRDVMAELHPPVLDDYGLAATLRWLAKRLSQSTDLKVEVTGETPSPRLAPAQALALFRIAQEALTNVVKHAGVKQVAAVLEDLPDAVRLTIADDGVGFDPAALAPEAGVHWGLLTMRERAEASGGRLHVKSAPGAGTRVVVEIPR